MALQMLVAVLLWAALCADPDLGEQVSDITFFCGIYPILTEMIDIRDMSSTQLVYDCLAINFHFHGKMSFLITALRVPSTEVEQPQVCPLAHSYFNFAAKISEPCYENITLVWDELWRETHGGRDVKKLYTVTNGTLNEWGGKQECYTGNFSREACYVLPPIFFYFPPVMMWVYVKPDSGPMLEDNFYTLFCNITVLSPVRNLTIRWLEGGGIINIHNSVTSQEFSYPLVIRMKRESTYTCQAEYILTNNVTQQEASLKVTSEFPDSSPVPDSRPVLVPVVIICVLTLFAVLALIFICIGRKRRGQYCFKVQSDNIALGNILGGNKLAT
ncbi:uncharacterized protein LOC119125901 isoform X1 [Syngnathus acus]|uniref:uncharacterized protein LOC119125901 isoform X1 n=1 Tax=Syngnathus acus TaxID=161584 RepID=UPI001885C021|nr:uncharacterized protein LOC119125901 isoform X1 [Syngnathus acus]